MEFYVLASGSQGNCSVIKSEKTLLIIDCGMTWKYLSEQFAFYQLDYRKAEGLLLTHQHSDHCAQLKRFNYLPKYVTFDLPDSERVTFYLPFTVGDFEITPLPLSHDSENTTGYLIKQGKEKLVYITDTGYLSERNRKYLKNADYYIMESNHDVEMLLNTNRPNMLKRRIICFDGHLSNISCAVYLAELVGKKTKEIVLAHLSQEANKPELALAKLQEIFLENDITYEKLIIQAAKQNEGCRGGKL